MTVDMKLTVLLLQMMMIALILILSFYVEDTFLIIVLMAEAVLVLLPDYTGHFYRFLNLPIQVTHADF